MNLFENIFDKFTKQAQPVPSFGTPQAPRTASYVDPNIPITTAPKISQGVRNGGFAPGYEGTVDETKGSFFQGLQGIQNVVRELPKALEATAQSGKKQFEQEISQKRQQFISDMLAQGYKKDDIFQAMDNLQAKGEFDFKPGIAGSIVGGLGERIGNISQTTERLSQIQNPFDRTVAGMLPYAGQTVATALQPITSAIEPYVSPVVQKVIEKTGQTENVQALSEGWSQFEKTNPILAENIAGLLNVSQLAPVPFAKPIANATGNVVKQTGKAIVRGAEKVAPVTKTIIKKPVQIVKNKAIDVFGKEVRPVQDIAGNILQPYKGMVENLDDATAGLRRVVDETGTKTDTFEGLLGKIEETQKKYGQMKQESLGGIVQTRKSASAQKALENLDSVYANVSSKDMLATQARVKELAKKNMEEGLTPLEMDEVKVLHTKSNNLFNEKGQATGGFSSDDLRGIRKDLKEEIELFAEENGVTNIRDINKVYGEISDAKTLAQNQVDNLRSYKGRQIPATRVQKIADFIMEFPVVKQAFADPARILASSLFKTLRGDKINPIEVQKRLPEFLKELKDAGMKSGDMQKVEKMIQNEIKLLPPASKEALLAEKIAQPDITKKSIIRQPTTNAKQQVIKPTSSDTIPEGYFKNAFGEIQKNPSNKKGGFIKIAPESKKLIKGDMETKIPKELQYLAEEAKKYKSAEEFYDAHMSRDLMDISNPAKQRFGRILEDGVDEDTGMYMNAKYTADKYGSRGNNEYKYQKSANVPDVKSENDIVTIYRSTSKKQKEMLPGDFVSFSKDYAEMHNPDGHTLILKVPAKDVVFQGNDLHEWIYSPESLRGKKYDGGLEGFYKKITK